VYRFLLALALLFACSQPGSIGGMTLSSPAFANNEHIPKQYTCDGANISPPLLIGGVPKAATSLTLVVTDPDAPGGTFTHWKATNIRPTVTMITEGGHPGQEQTNGFGKIGYGGPCPPSGEHHYVFTVTALDASGKTVGQATLTGTYKK